jgi:hypothetical protein
VLACSKDPHIMRIYRTWTTNIRISIFTWGTLRRSSSKKFSRTATLSVDLFSWS